MRLSSFAFLAPSLVLAGAVALAACGGKTDDAAAAEPIPGTPAPALPAPTPSSSPSAPSPGPVGPALPTTPHSSTVSTNDVSILFPLPARGDTGGLLRGADGGALGPLVPRAAWDMLRRGQLDFDAPSAYEDLALVALRLDPCGRRPSSRACRSEIRAVFQGVSADPGGGARASDGGVHVIYEVGDEELVETLREILTARFASGDTQRDVLGPHPILAAEGLAGPFATRLRAIVRRHLGETRVVRVTSFDHNFHFDGDGWTFDVVDRVGGRFVEGTIPGFRGSSLSVIGSPARGEILTTSAELLGDGTPVDDVGPLVSGSRLEPSPRVSLGLAPTFDAVARVESPTSHHAESVDCATCHLAEGAHRIGETSYGLSSNATFRGTKPTTRIDVRTSVTNLHAFGYLGRDVAVSQRTANESSWVAAALERSLTPR